MTLQLTLFGAIWCTDCRDIAPAVHALAARHNLPLDEVDIEKRYLLAERLKIRSVPTLIAVIDSDEIRLTPPTPDSLRDLETRIERAKKPQS